MDGIHDLGGMHGFGRVEREVDEPVFHARWEARVFAMLGAAAVARALPNVDRFRHAVERIDPVAYLSHGYYGRWLGGLENLLVEAGVVTQREIEERLRARGGEIGLVAARPAAVPDPLGPRATAPGAARELERTPRFSPGARVRTRPDVVAGHTRLPRYARGKRGRVVAWHGGWVLPDANAHGRGERPEHLYGVAFEGTELWGEAGDGALEVHLDLFESYLEPA